MRYAVVHTFDIEAEDHDQAMARLRDLRQKIDRASERLGIGYSGGSMRGTPQPPPPIESRVPRQISA